MPVLRRDASDQFFKRRLLPLRLQEKSFFDWRHVEVHAFFQVQVLGVDSGNSHCKTIAPFCRFGCAWDDLRECSTLYSKKTLLVMIWKPQTVGAGTAGVLRTA